MITLRPQQLQRNVVFFLFTAVELILEIISSFFRIPQRPCQKENKSRC